MEKWKLVPVLMGADLNAYNIARAFHEEYNVISYAFGRYAIGATEYTRIIKFKAVEGLDNPSILIDTLNTFAKSHEGETLILFGCTDDYVQLICKNRELISHRYVIPYIGWDLMGEITLKEKFYQYCDKYRLPYPKTVVFSKDDKLGKLPFDYPIIIKPSSSPLYWHHSFEGMKKVYRAADSAAAEKIIGDIYASGYPDKLILQDTIPGNDTKMYVLTAYCDKTAKVRMMCLGHVLLEEHTPKGLGNHCAIVTECNEPIMNQLKAFLEAIGYVGYANFDIKFDERDGSLRIFEINTRLGRSNYYITAAGYNAARYIVEDWVLNKQLEGCEMCKNEVYWRYVPDKVVFKYISPEQKATVQRLIAEKKAFSSMRYKYDLRFNPRRWFFVTMHERNHIKKFEKYYVNF